jgi:hypothetical protein
MPEKTQMPSIPTPVKGNLDSVHDTLMEMKQTLEIMMGTRGNWPVTRTFVQDGAPTAFSTGDQWIDLNSGVMRYWNGEDWLFVRPAP